MPWRTAATLNAQGIGVHPIVYPAVELHRARLRFFVSALHSHAQLRRADLLQAALAEHGVIAEPCPVRA